MQHRHMLLLRARKPLDPIVSGWRTTSPGTLLDQCVRIATGETTPRPSRTTLDAWTIGFQTSSSSPELPSPFPLREKAFGRQGRWWSTPTPTRTVPWYNMEPPVLSSLSERAGSCGCPILACSRYRAWGQTRCEGSSVQRIAAFSGQLPSLDIVQWPLQCCSLHACIYTWRASQHLSCETSDTAHGLEGVRGTREPKGKGSPGKRKGKRGKGSQLDWRLSFHARGAYGGSLCREAAFSHIDHAESAASTRGDGERGVGEAGSSACLGGVALRGGCKWGQARPDPAGLSMTGIFTVRIDPRMKQNALIGCYASL
jgi:hypothetical protein